MQRYSHSPKDSEVWRVLTTTACVTPKCPEMTGVEETRHKCPARELGLVRNASFFSLSVLLFCWLLR